MLAACLCIIRLDVKIHKLHTQRLTPFFVLGLWGKGHPQVVNCLANSFCYTWSGYVIMMVMVIYHINSMKRKVDNHPGANLTS